MQSMKNIGMLGAGSWGMALCWVLQKNGHKVTVWSALDAEIAMLKEKREQVDKLPGVILAEDTRQTLKLLNHFDITKHMISYHRHNEDDKINVKDATYLQKSLAKMIYLTESAKLLADADNNGKLNVRDATTIQKYIAGMNVNW